MNGDKLAEARQAIAYSRNFATAKPDIGATEREHILGLCDVLSGIIAAHSAQGVGDEPKVWRCYRERYNGDGSTTYHTKYAKTEADMLIALDEGFLCELLAAPTKETP